MHSRTKLASHHMRSEADGPQALLGFFNPWLSNNIHVDWPPSRWSIRRSSATKFRAKLNQDPRLASLWSALGAVAWHGIWENDRKSEPWNFHNLIRTYLKMQKKKQKEEKNLDLLHLPGTLQCSWAISSTNHQNWGVPEPYPPTSHVLWSPEAWLSWLHLFRQPRNEAMVGDCMGLLGWFFVQL